MKRAIILLSGGIDSTTTLAIAKNEGYDLYALSFDYNQRHRIELEMARRNARRFMVRQHLIVSSDLRGIAISALTSNDIEVPKQVTSKNQKQHATCNMRPATFIPVTYVPARNVIFLSFALAWAETIGSEDIFIGANTIDYSGYPDCRPEFIKAFEDMANLAMKTSVEGRARFKIHSPLINMSKSQIIKKGIELGVDFSETWSCYDPMSITPQPPNLPTFQPLVPCGRCDSCLLREKGFKEAGIEDPLILKVKH